MSDIIKIAFHTPTQKLIHIDNASNGLSCKCICLKCNEQLEAVQGEIWTKHFRHNANLNCEGSHETALHELGKQILLEHSQIAMPKHGVVNYSNPIAEKRLDTFRPDVSAIYDDQKIFFEIFVSHAVDQGKEKFFVEKKHRSVEIDLSDCNTSSYEEIKKLILDETYNKKVFYWTDEKLFAPKEKTISENQNNWIVRVLAFDNCCRTTCREPA